MKYAEVAFHGGVEQSSVLADYRNAPSARRATEVARDRQRAPREPAAEERTGFFYQNYTGMLLGGLFCMVLTTLKLLDACMWSGPP